MSNQAVVEKLIAERNWYGLFDALDADKNGTLSHQEFWKWEKIGDSQELLDALNKFNVSFYEIIRKNFERIFLGSRSQ